MTRPLADDAALASLLASHGHGTVRDPLLRIEVVAPPSIEREQLQAVVATSANALRALPGRSDLAQLRVLPLFAVGAATATAARAFGFKDVHEGDAGASDLVHAIIARHRPGAGKVLYIRGQDVAFDLAPVLAGHGLAVMEAVVYRAVPATHLAASSLAGIASASISGVILMSPRTAEIYAALIAGAGLGPRLGGIAHYCLSGRVAASLGRLGALTTRVPARPDLQELVALIDRDATHSRPSG